MSNEAAVILLGAGASYGSNEAYFGTNFNDRRTPPLGKDLFPQLENAGGIAASLPSALKKVFQVDFEKGMKKFFEEQRRDLMQFQRELAFFLASFSPGRRNNYLEMLNKLVNHKVIYTTLNYDLLLECSAGMQGRKTGYHVEFRPDSINLLKIHGSSNFWPAVNATFVDCDIQGIYADIEAPVKCLSPAETIQKCRSGGNGLQPAIAIFAEGKAVTTCPGFIQHQQTMWRASIANAAMIFISGVRVHEPDDHIWTPLGTTNSPVIYFGFEADRAEFTRWREKWKKENASFEATDFKGSIPKMKEKLDLYRRSLGDKPF